MISSALVSVKIMRVEGKSKSSASGERESEVSESRVYSSEGSVGDILEYRGISSRVYTEVKARPERAGKDKSA